MNGPMAGAASVAARAGETVVRRLRSALDSHGGPALGGTTTSGWLVVTVLRDLPEVDTSVLPAPLAEFGDRIEVRTSSAPAEKGTELAARLVDRPTDATALDRLRGSDPQAELRSALRQAKQLLEVGEVLAVDPAPHGERTPTPGGALLEAWTKAAPKGGVR